MVILEFISANTRTEL